LRLQWSSRWFKSKKSDPNTTIPYTIKRSSNHLNGSTQETKSVIHAPSSTQTTMRSIMLRRSSELPDKTLEVFKKRKEIHDKYNQVAKETI